MESEPKEKTENYRQEAHNLRVKAAEMKDTEARAQLLLVASLYDKLADHLLVLALQRSGNSRPEDTTE